MPRPKGNRADIKGVEDLTPELKQKLINPGKYKTDKKRPDKDIQVEPGDNNRMLLNNLAIYTLPRIDLKNEELVQDRIYEYFQIIAERDMKPGVASLAMALGIDRTTFWRIANGADGTDRTYPPGVRNCFKRSYQMLAAVMEDYMQNGKINPASGIFLMKNMGAGYKDVSDLVVSQSAPEHEYSAGDIADRYKITD